jgi:hypothetical protein
MRFRKVPTIVAAVLTIGSSNLASAQGVAADAKISPEFGASVSVSTVPYTLFSRADANFPQIFGSWAGASGGGCSGTANCASHSAPSLPTGAVIVGLDLVACDEDPSGVADVQLFECETAQATCTLVTTTGTGVPEVPGCGITSGSPLNLTVQNTTRYLVLIARVSGPTAPVRFRAAQLRYRLQVSPAPSVATFPNDVPTTHPFFRFVEALAAAGITGGCGAGSYCPDQPVTRGQMAVFLATSLGLHFPN